MQYHLSAHSLHLPEEVSQKFQRKLDSLDKLLPPKAKQQSAELHLHHNSTHKIVEGSLELHLPGKTLTARHQDRSVTLVMDKLLSKLKHQLTTYKTTHDRHHSDYPSQQSIRKDVDPGISIDQDD